MLPWRPHPRAMDDDVRLLLLGPEAQAVAFRLAARSVNGSVSVGSDPAAAVAAICGGAVWAPKGLGDLERAGLIVRDADALTLAWEWPSLAGGAPSSSAGAPAGAVASRGRAEGGRAAERRLRALWSRYNVAPAARTAWVDSPAGSRFIEREQHRDPAHDRAWALDLAGQLVADNRDNRGRFGCPSARTTVADNSTDNHTDNSPPSPTPSSPEKNNKSSAPERAHERTTASDNHTDNSPTTGDADNRTTAADNSAPSAAEVLMRLRGDGKLRLSVSTTHEAELERALSSVSPVWTLAGVERLARHMGAGHLRDGWRPRLDDLRGKDGTWSRLLTLHDEAQDCARCRREDRRSPPSPGATAAPRQTELKPVSDEERKAAARAVMERRKAREKAEASAAAEAARQRMATVEMTHG